MEIQADMSNVFIIDFESTIRGQPKDRPNPCHPNNFPVFLGLSRLDRELVRHEYVVFKFYNVEKDEFCDNPEFTQYMDDFYLGPDTLLVGHNITFDLLYLRRLYPLFRPSIFDTSVAHYLITEQQGRWPSLDKVIEYYDLPMLKDTRLKECWEEGIDTTHINPDLILPYLQNDVDATEKIFRYQINDLDRLGMMNVFRASMAAQVHTTEMTWNGMRVDKAAIIYHATRYKTWLDSTAGSVISKYGFDINSPQSMSCFLFGGTTKKKQTEVVKDESGSPIIYKSGIKKGEVRTRQIEVDHHVRARYDPVVCGSVRGKAGYWSVADDVLKKLSVHDPDMKFLTDYRRRSKVYNSFLKAYLDILEGCDSPLIHPNINNTATYTGRLSQSKPNLQQVP